MLYLNNNEFISFPTEIKGLKNIKYLDLHDNRITPNSYQNIQNQNFGIKINF
jgi:Leucine-rich repeat (LRR) protein